MIMRLGFLPGLGTVKDLFSGECLKAVSKVENRFQTLLLHAWIVPEPVHLLHKILLQWGKPYLKIRQISIANVWIMLYRQCVARLELDIPLRRGKTGQGATSTAVREVVTPGHQKMVSGLIR